jgi:hypothetical protein
MHCRERCGCVTDDGGRGWTASVFFAHFARTWGGGSLPLRQGGLGRAFRQIGCASNTRRVGFHGIDGPRGPGDLGGGGGAGGAGGGGGGAGGGGRGGGARGGGKAGAV